MCKEVMKLDGIGPITASAIVATVGDAKVCKNGRHQKSFAQFRGLNFIALVGVLRIVHKLGQV